MTISGNYADEAALTVFDQQIHKVMEQTKFRCEAFLSRMPFSPGNKGKLQRVHREFSEGMPVELTERFSPIVQTNESRFDSRWISCKQHVSVELVSDEDIQESLFDPTGRLATRQVERFNRKLDYDSVRSMFATVQTGGGEAPSSTVSFAADNGVTITATSGLTYEKMLEIKETLIDDEVINENDVNLYMGIGGPEHTNLLNEIEFTNGLYTSKKNAETGEIDEALGIKLIRFGRNATDPILPVSGGVRTGFCITDKAMQFRVQREMETIVDRDPTRHQTWRVRTYMKYGFLRMDGRHVMKVTYTA